MIVIFPIVQGYYIFEKVQKGKSARALTNWVKEFCVTVFIQLVHAVVYSVLIEGILSTFKEEDGALQGNIILFVFCVTFLFKAEGIVKSIFNVKSPGNALGDAITSAATAGVVVKKTKEIFGSKNKSNSKAEAEDKKDAAEHAKNVKTMESTAGQKNKEEATRTDEKGSKSGEKGSSKDSGSSGKPDGKGSKPSSSTDGESKPGKKDSKDPDIEVKEKDSREEALREAEKAKEVLAHLASKKRTKGIPGKVAKGAVSLGMRTTAVAVGAMSGLATGDIQKAVGNAVILDGAAKRVARGVNKITGAAANRLGGAVMRAKVQHGGYKKQLEKAGVDVDKIYGAERDKTVQKALAQFASAERRGGDALGESKWARAVNTKITEKESKNTKTK